MGLPEPRAWVVLVVGIFLGRLSVSVTHPTTCLSPSWSPIAVGDARIYYKPNESMPGLPQPPTKPGEGFKFEDARGSYERVEYPGGEYVNLVYTRAGHKRSGDIHKCAQVNTVVVGEALLTQVMKDGGETQTKLRGGDHVVIPPHVPHLYEFTRDTLMTESWTHREPDADRAQCEFEAWFHKKLRARIDAQSTVRDGGMRDGGMRDG